jgi:DnaJ-domain-containing protein 1
MAGAQGNALEWALALLRAPAERHALRQRPLPDGVEDLLAIAAGARPAVLADAVAASGEPESVLREAARFYAREVLFFPSADAYRTLGVRPDAEPEAIKAHHRLLQHWLHPDRQENDDDAVFAARVNTAWNQLRGPAQRAAYDAALDAVRQHAAPTVTAAPLTMQESLCWAAADAEPPLPAPRWQRWPAFAFGATCLVLVGLVMVEANRAPPSVPLAEDAGTGSDASDGETLGISVPTLRKAVAVLQRAVTPARRAPEPVPVAAGPVPPESAVATLAPAPVAPRLEPASEAPLAAKPIVPMPAIAPPPRITVAVDAPPATATTAPPLAAVASAPAADLPDPARVRSARQTGVQLLGYLGEARRSAPPIWNNPGVQARAQALRAQWQDRGRVRVADPQWRVGHERAGFRAAYEVAGEPAGVVSVDMTWRAEQWLVTAIDVERTQ